MPPPPESEDSLLKVTKPNLGGEKVTGNKKHKSSYDLVEQIQYLYVHVVKAKDLPGQDVNGTCDPYVEVRVGNYKVPTAHIEKNTYPKWNQVFAFLIDHLQSSLVLVTVKDKDIVHGKDDFMGRVLFHLEDVPKRFPPDNPLVPQWYSLEDGMDKKVEGELKLAVWIGTQADEAFSDAWCSDAVGVIGTDVLANIRSKEYISPKLWYLRVSVLEAMDLQPIGKCGCLKVDVKASMGNQALRTRTSQSSSVDHTWDEDLIFVVGEPFEDPLILSVEDRVAPNKNEVLGTCIIPLCNVDWRLDLRSLDSKWYDLEQHVAEEEDQKQETHYPRRRIHVRICLEGGYHVLDESTKYCSDFRPTAKELWKPSVGVLELGILGASGLMPTEIKDGQKATGAYCVAKYGETWFRTRTIINSFNPKWNEQYSWNVYDPCTVITIGVFYNCHLYGGEKSRGAKDSRIGKVRIRLSTLDTNRVYAHWYPLIVLHPRGVKKMGEIQLAVRLTCSSLLNMMRMYSQPLLPNMHYLHPLKFEQHDFLGRHAIQIVSMRLSLDEPPLRKEVVEYMLDVGSDMWSMRKSKAHFFRIMSVFSEFYALGKWYNRVCNWENHSTTILIHILYVILVIYPEFILPAIFLYPFLIGAWNYRWRPRHPPYIKILPSHADPDELNEEFDTFPTSQTSHLLRIRYDRLRTVSGRIQAILGDVAHRGESLESLMRWRDPRATVLCMIIHLVAAIVVYVTPIKVVALLTGFYVLRHPRFRRRGSPSMLMNFIRRLPTRTDCFL